MLNFIVIHAFAQEVTVTGEVRSSTGGALQGVTISNQTTKKVLGSSNNQGHNQGQSSRPIC